MDLMQAKTYALRQNILDIVMAGKCGHIGGDMSVIDVLAVLYDRMNITPETADDPDRDRLILSKGHCVEALYAVLADRGFFPLEDVLSSYSRFGSKYIGHPSNRIPGIEMNSGSLGHGLAVGVGMALAGKMDRRPYRVYVVMGDGELAEGSVWEAAMAAAHYRLDRLCAVVDCNRLQISGPTNEVMSPGDLCARWRSFGWRVLEVPDGNSVSALRAALDQAEETQGQPTVLLAHTVKGKGSSVMEDRAAWHHRVPAPEEYTLISADFARRREALLHE